MMRNWQRVFGLMPPAIMLAVVGMAGVAPGAATPQIRAGENHTVMLRTNGTIWTCGDNDLGQLGDGTTTARNVPAQVGTATNWTAVSGGMHHTLALKADGTLWAWGDNTLGQLGIGEATADLVHLEPVQVGTDTNWKAISAGDYHSLALKKDGTLWAWGDSEDGVLGTGETYSGIILATPTQVGTDTNWVAMSAAGQHTMALKANGLTKDCSNGCTLFGWGANSSVQLGDRSNLEARAPVQVGTDFDWADISSHKGHTLARKKDGRLFAFGLNDHGQLGLANLAVDPFVPTYTSANRDLPTQINSDLNWSAIAAGDGHSLALKGDGTLWAWGDNSDGALGVGLPGGTQTTPVRIGSASNWTAVSAGENSSVLMNSTGTVWEMGDNTFGQLCNGSNTAKAAPTPGISPVSGDVNEDGDVTVADAVQALRIAISLATPGAAEVVAGDVGPLTAGNVPAPDGAITLGDAVIILRKVVGLVDF